MVLLGELDKLALAHIVAKPKPLLAHARADLDSGGVWTWDAVSEKYFLLKVFLCGVLEDMLGSAKLSRMAGHMALYGCHFSMVRGARPSKDKGMMQYYTIEKCIS